MRRRRTLWGISPQSTGFSSNRFLAGISELTGFPVTNALHNKLLPEAKCIIESSTCPSQKRATTKKPEPVH
ncbi:hypothetical protein F2P81_000989 [Scophthalmus maximus]|uniref:Uncharacterized protein n=1 Tax=Scophthalmus maximus TaxID=52904 RepID=A0A6A4TIL3_SCOMX|nr:hypothetical protein F2P81_000989 [Scophthalmus maximus]